MFKYMSVQVENYKRFKESLDAAMTGAADHMVRVGYLLMQARDTDILNESGYSGMGEFAQKEYGLSPDQTSRFISIAERFGDGEGRLQDQWQQFGYSKLSEMLSLPDAINEALSPEITREEIRELKAEVKEEEKITPIEAAIEQAEVKAADPDVENEPLIKRFFREFFRGCPQEFVKAMLVDWKHAWQGEPKARETVLEALAPSGIEQLVARVQGVGKYMLSFKGEETLPVLIGIRDSSCTELSWTDVRHGFSDLIDNVPSDFDKEPEEEARMLWSEIYGEPFPEEEKKEEKKPEKDKKVKIAPAQAKKKEPKVEKNIVDISKITPVDQQIKVTGTPKDTPDAPGTRGGGTVKIEPPAAAPTAFQPAPRVNGVAKIGERELQRIADGLRSIADEVEDIYTRPKEELDGMRSEIEDLRGKVNLVIENARLWLNVSEEQG